MLPIHPDAVACAVCGAPAEPAKGGHLCSVNTAHFCESGGVFGDARVQPDPSARWQEEQRRRNIQVT